VLNSRLQHIAHFEPVAATLVHLCLSNQRISEMQGLTTLTQLRTLYLHNNRIERIEGLERCVDGE
jgi:Leucine-rich repeat (LRR) protein